MSLLYTHSRELTSSLNELKEPSSSTDWILFGYDGDDITLINSGSNGLEEIKDEFDEESVQYALLKIFDETSKMLRFIYIAWCGEYAPPFQKANFSQHSQVLENFFKGYHVRINARCYEDVEPENIISKVQNSSFINFSTKVAPTPFKKPVFNLPNKPADSELRKLPTPSQLSQMKPTQSFQLGVKKPETNQIPTPSVSPTPTKTTSAPAPAPAPRPNPLSPRANPLAPRANPLAPRANPLAPRANPLAPRNNPLSPKSKVTSISKSAAPAPAPAPVASKPAVSVSSPKPTAASTTTSVPAPKPTPSVGYNPLNPRRNPLAPARRNPLAPSRPNPLNQNAPLTEPTPSGQSEKVTIKPVTPVGPPRVSVKTNAFEGIKLESETEPVVENEGIDTSSRDSVANVRKMFEKKPEKKINKVMLKSQLFSEGNKEYATKARVREERLRREQEDNALLEREKLANKQRELQDEIAETRKATSPEPSPFRSNPLNSPKSNPLNANKSSLSPKINPLNANKSSLSPKINPLNANKSSLSPKMNPLNANKFSLSPKINPLNPNKSNSLSPKINPLNANKTNPVSPKINPLNANKTNPVSPKINPLNANKTNPVSPKINPLNANKTNPVSPKINPLNANKSNPLNPSNSAPALPPREAAPALPPRENPLAPKSNPLNPKRANPLNPSNSAPALPPRDAAPALPARTNPLAPPPLPQRVLNSGSVEKEEKERKEREERERKEREEKERKEREEKERKEREEKERKEREERERKEREEKERKEREEQEKLNARSRAASTGNGDYAIVAYDYEPQEENEIALVEGEIVKNIIQLDEGWWQGQNSKGEVGLFPANFVELQASAPAAPAPAPAPVSAPAPVQKSSSAIALYDYDAQEENEISFKEGDIITNLNFVTDDWWEGVVDGKCGLFPGNYVQVNQ